ncbi:Wzz/FepE/Etk N-terminal domain-containing protein [Streptomyces purpurogeneiscleroticus]|uniref:Wzz/FepE/Etk N-terminal domain-containing protein n=1 Tax=Streptomyces purpurogeneiscleroticus TaxID=68259 RepID=UPI001CBF1486|nr:Wzz/FepE/Etk N-terminal domain-containing protein [Streptomyces purpurogeneiscleroticus]MBZ4017936.1 polysaccharide biosynthesis protein [Streptomyces purpurogeneiscleroticus]
MTTSTTSEPSAAAPLIDLQALVVAVRRRRRLWCALTLLGLLAGAAVAVLLPPPPTAVTKVLVAHKEDQPNDTGTLIRTDVEVLGTSRIAGKALRSLKSPEKPEDFMKDYRGTGLTNNLLQIDVTGDSDAEAVARAEALADAFIADHVRRMRETAKAEAEALLDQRDRMRDELARVNKAIGVRSPESDPKASASNESLFARRAELNSRIADFDQRAADAGTGTPKVVAGTQIVDAPRAVRHSLPRAVATDGAIGLVLGLVVGLALAAVGAVVADRPVLRRDIAAHLGASVIAELPRRSGGRWQRRRTRAARERLTTTLVRTVRGSAEPVSLLELGCARSTSAIATDLTGALGAEGPVVGVGSVAPGTAWTDLPYLGTRTVLVVRAGHGSAAWLHTVARQLADQRIPVIGVVLIDPDPRDRTDGTLWDGLHIALRGQSELLARQNGTVRRPKHAARVPDNDQEAR